jgi:hypothetical protein
MKSRRSRQGRNGRRPKQEPTAAGPPTSATAYAGPSMPLANGNPRTRTIRLTAVFVLSFSASPGSLRYTNDPSGSSEWSNASATWEEFRVLSQRLRFVPSLENFSNTAGLATLYAPVCWYVQRNSGSPAPTSLTAAFQFDSAKPRSIQQGVTMVAKATTPTEMAFQNVTSTSATWTIGVNQDSLTALTTYGLVFNEMLVQFRAKD